MQLKLFNDNKYSIPYKVCKRIKAQCKKKQEIKQKPVKTIQIKHLLK
jgi:hypothetical protein